MRSAFFDLEPLGIGSLEVESFSSFFYRLARIHTTSPYSLSVAIGEWWSKRIGNPVSLSRGQLYDSVQLCGYTSAVATYVRAVSEAIGRSDVSRTTLLALHDVACGKCQRVLHQGRFWCPACMEEAMRLGTIYYDRLLWNLLAIERCPIHKVRLESTCPSCGSHQRSSHATSSRLHCWACGRPLPCKASAWRLCEKPSFGERDCCDLIAAISDGRLVKGAPNAFRVFSDELLSMMQPLIATRSVKHAGADEKWREVRSWRHHRPPSFSTMLSRCHTVGVSLLDVVEDPVEAAHQACQLEFARCELPVHRKPIRSSEVKRMVEARMAGLLASPGKDPLPSLAALARELQVSVGYIRYRFPALVTPYCERLRLQKLYRHRSSTVASVNWLHSAEMPEAFAALGRSRRALAKHVSLTFGTSINVARYAIRDAFIALAWADRAGGD